MSFEEQPPTTTVRIGLPARARLAFVALAATFGLVLAVGILGPTSPRVVRPSDAAVGTIAPVPSAPSRPPAAAPGPLAEHLPQLERYGPDAPTGDLLLLAEASQALGPGVAHRVLDLRIGRLGPPLTSDPILPLADGGFLCACVDRPWSASTERASIRAIRLSARGDAGEESGSLDLEGIAAPLDESPALAFSTAFAPAGEFVAVAAAERDDAGDWRVRLGVVGFDRPPVTLDLGAVPGTSVLAVNPLDPAVSPDGRSIAVQVAVFRRTESGDRIQEGATWLVPVHGARLGPARSLDERGQTGLLAEFAEFTSPDLYAKIVPTADIVGWDVRTYDLDGRLLHAASLEPAPERPMFAAAGGAILAWDGVAHTAYRVDPVGGLAGRSVDLAVALGPGWRAVDPETAPDPPMAAAPAGDRLYGVGYEIGPGAESTVPSIWVLGGDDGALEQLDHWFVDGRPTSMAVSPDGRWLFVAEEAGVTSDGRPSTRQASVAAYDTTTGDRALFAGRLGTGFLELARGP